MPPKAKPHKNTGKSAFPKLPSTNSSATSSREINNSNNESQPSTPPSGISLSSEQEQQFEVELCWCIEQLQKAIVSKKLNNKQVTEHTKALNSLMSNSAPIIKKRQVMRLCFGDYRAKMTAEEKKAKGVSIKVSTAVPSKKSVFLKKAAHPVEENMEDNIYKTSDNGFRFNFDAPAEDK